MELARQTLAVLSPLPPLDFGRDQLGRVQAAAGQIVRGPPDREIAATSGAVGQLPRFPRGPLLASNDDALPLAAVLLRRDVMAGRLKGVDIAAGVEGVGISAGPIQRWFRNCPAEDVSLWQSTSAKVDRPPFDSPLSRDRARRAVASREDGLRRTAEPCAVWHDIGCHRCNAENRHGRKSLPRSVMEFACRSRQAYDA